MVEISTAFALLYTHGNELQKPVFSPTEKQLASWLKLAERAMLELSLSIAGLVFMVSK